MYLSLISLTDAQTYVIVAPDTLHQLANLQTYIPFLSKVMITHLNSTDYLLDGLSTPQNATVSVTTNTLPHMHANETLPKLLNFNEENINWDVTFIDTSYTGSSCLNHCLLNTCRQCPCRPYCQSLNTRYVKLLLEQGKIAIKINQIFCVEVIPYM